MSSNHSLGSSQSGNDVFNLRNPISSLALTPASNTNSTTVVRTNPTSSSSDVRTAPTNKSNTISTFSAHDGASKRLLAEYQQLQKNPVEGVAYVRPRESDLFNWDVAFFGAPDTPYQGGYFKGTLKINKEYPFKPPNFNFTSAMFHPNVFKEPTGGVCISILHPPGDEPMYQHEPNSERWNPTHSIASILISIVSLLADPNPNSIANVDAAVSFRKWRETKDPNSLFIQRVKEIVKQSQDQAEQDGITIPKTNEEYINYNKPFCHPSEDDPDDVPVNIDDSPEDVEVDADAEEDDAYGTEENEMAEEPGASSGESVCSPASGGSECGPQQPPEHQSPAGSGSGIGSGNDNDSELDSPPRSNSKKSRLGSPDSGAARSAPH